MPAFLIHRLLLPCLLALALTTGLPAIGQPASSVRTIENPKARLLEKRKKRERLERGLRRQQTLVEATRRQEEDLLAKLEAINTELSRERAKLNELENQLAEVSKGLADLQRQLTDLEARQRAARRHVRRRLAAVYKTGEIGLLNILFSSRSLGELEDDAEYYRRMTARDRAALDDYRQKIAAVRDKRAELDRRRATLEGLAATVRKQEKRLDEVRRRQEELLARVRTEKHLYERALAELRAAADRLQQRLATLAGQTPTKKPPTAPAPPPLTGLRFAARKGKLPPPVAGRVVTRFGRHRDGRAGVTIVADGIDIAAAPGSPVRAVHHGRVVYAGTLRGYGNILILDHGDRYYSLYSRLEVLYKKKGETVIAGEIIGMLGEEAGLIDRGLHFEIRHGTTPVDPLSWLDGTQLAIADKKSVQ